MTTQSRPGSGLAIAGVALLLVVAVTQVYIWVNLWPVSITWAEAMQAAIPLVIAWSLMTPAVLKFGDLLPIERHRAASRILIHLALSFALAFAALIAVDVSDRLLNWSTAIGVPSYLVSRLRNNVLHLHMGVAVYWVVLAARHATGYYAQLRENELRASRLEAELAVSRIEALRSQLQPHFLFNSLNAIAVLMRRDASTAEEMLHRVSDLLRATLDSADVQELPLQEEIELVRTYLGIEETRFRNRLSVRVTVASDAADGMVPNLLLQPLVENAIRHGIAPRAEGGSVEIAARRFNGRLEIRVSDDGVGLAAERGGPREGVGLSNTRRRLETLYGPDHEFWIGPLEGGGTEVVVTLPYRAAERPAEDPG